jgi:hypothetical protein
MVLMHLVGEGTLVQARVCRSLPFQRKGGSKNAEIVSDALPFLEYELQRQLVLKLKVSSVTRLTLKADCVIKRHDNEKRIGFTTARAGKKPFLNALSNSGAWDERSI